MQFRILVMYNDKVGKCKYWKKMTVEKDMLNISANGT